MPKTLLIMRHAKSSWSNPGLSDHERPLNNRGLRDAPKMARFIESLKLAPEMLVSSTAKRAKSTARLFVENCDEINCEVVTTEELYHAPASAYLNCAGEFADSIQTALLVGHNPGMEHLIELLAGEYERMPTAAIAHVVFDADSWKDIAVENGIVRSVWRPKDI